MAITTTKHGLRVRAVTRAVTKGDIVDIARGLTAALGVDVEPESISEGGFLLHVPSDCPGGRQPYKSIRLWRSQSQRWPWVPDEWASEWSGNTDVVF